MSTLDTAAQVFEALQALAPDERAKFAALYAGGTGTGAVVLQLVSAKTDVSVPVAFNSAPLVAVDEDDEEEADLSAEDAADFLGVSAQVLRRYIKAGQIKASRGRPGSPPQYPMEALRDLKSSLKR
jgi:hypothetical protein